jgi:nicotinamidase/pyrazinamidase
MGDDVGMKHSGSALLLVDVQNDFCPGGALAVPEGDRVVPVLNRYIDEARANGWDVYVSRDWHPLVTRHFKDHGGPWPAHCVENTDGARFHRRLALPADAIVVTKGDNPDDHGYSAFDGTTPDGKPFLADLRDKGVNHLYVGGLATDYCVKHSVLDARRSGFDVTVLVDAIAGVELQPGDSARAIEEMRTAGAKIRQP